MFSGCSLPSNSKEAEPGSLALCGKNLDDLIDCGNIAVRVYLPLIQKDFVTHMMRLISRKL